MATSINGVEINEETGLPVVPADHYWEVSEYDDYYRIVYEVRLRKLVWIHGKFKYTRPWFYFGFQRRVWVDGHDVAETVKSHIVNQYDLGESNDLETKKLVGHYVTKEAFQCIAIDMYKDFEKEQKQKAETKVILGKYPPKSLGDF